MERSVDMIIVVVLAVIIAMFFVWVLCCASSMNDDERENEPFVSVCDDCIFYKYCEDHSQDMAFCRNHVTK